MESLREILKRTQTPGTTSSGAETAPRTSRRGDEITPGTCPTCAGRGWLVRDVPVGHPDFSRPLPCECQALEFEQGRQARLERYSNLGPLTRLTFESLLPRGRSNDPQNQELFAGAVEGAMAFAGEPQGWLLLTGPSGSGKTHLAAAIANRRIQQGDLAFFVVVPDLLDHLRSAYSPSSDVTYNDLFEQVRSAPLLVLDDLGSHASTPWAQEKLFQVLNHRFNAQLPTVVTTESLQPLEERLRTRLTDPSLVRHYELQRAMEKLYQETGGMRRETLENMTFDSFNTRGMGGHEDERESLERALRAASDFAESPKLWLVLVGPSGCGKTHLAAAIANRQLHRGRPVYFAEVPDLLDYLRSSYGEDSEVTYDKVFEAVKNSPLLILDDLPKETGSAWAREKLYQVLNYRYNSRLPTVVTTACLPEELEDRVESRLYDPKLCNIVPIIAPYYRGSAKTQPEPPARPRRPRRSH